VRVPVLDLDHYAGGLQPLKEGGGNQTKNLRLGTPIGTVRLPAGRQGERHTAGTTPRYGDRKDLPRSGQRVFPAASVIIPPITEAAGVLHDTGVRRNASDRR
jgi:hypothetical protein